MSAAPDISKQIEALAEQLAAEPFCQKYSLAHQSLAKVSLFIEQREDTLAPVAPEAQAMHESFRQFKAIYCLFLMQLEQLGPVDDRYLDGHTLSDFLAAAPSPGPQAIGPTVIEEPAETDLDLPDEPTDPHAQGASDVTIMGNIYNFVAQGEEREKPGPESETEPVPDPDQTGSIVVDLSAPGTEEPSIDWAPEPEPTPELQFAPEPEPEPLPELEFAPRPEPLSEPEFAAQQPEPELKGGATPTSEDELAPLVPEVPPTEAGTHRPPPPEPGPAEPSLPQPREYFALRLYLEALEQQGAGIPEGPLRRMQAMMLCFALEHELQEKLGPGLRRLWPKRHGTLETLYPNGVACQPLVQEWNGFAKKLIFDTRPALAQALKRWADDKGPTLPAPSLEDSAVWLFCLGVQSCVQLPEAQDAVELPLWKPEQVSQLCGHVLGANHLKLGATDPARPFSSEQMQQLVAHANWILQLTHHWKPGQGE